jgi:hypothetical protein
MRLHRPGIVHYAVAHRSTSPSPKARGSSLSRWSVRGRGPGRCRGVVAPASRGGSQTQRSHPDEHERIGSTCMNYPSVKEQLWHSTQARRSTWRITRRVERWQQDITGSTRHRSRAEMAASNAWRGADGGFTFDAAPSAVTSAAATARRPSMHRVTRRRPAIR